MPNKNIESLSLEEFMQYYEELLNRVDMSSGTRQFDNFGQAVGAGLKKILTSRSKLSPEDVQRITLKWMNGYYGSKGLEDQAQRELMRHFGPQFEKSALRLWLDNLMQAEDVSSSEANRLSGVSKDTIQFMADWAQRNRSALDYTVKDSSSLLYNPSVYEARGGDQRYLLSAALYLSRPNVKRALQQAEVSMSHLAPHGRLLPADALKQELQRIDNSSKTASDGKSVFSYLRGKKVRSSDYSDHLMALAENEPALKEHQRSAIRGLLAYYKADQAGLVNFLQQLQVPSHDSRAVLVALLSAAGKHSKLFQTADKQSDSSMTVQGALKAKGYEGNAESANYLLSLINRLEDKELATALKTHLLSHSEQFDGLLKQPLMQNSDTELLNVLKKWANVS